MKRNRFCNHWHKHKAAFEPLKIMEQIDSQLNKLGGFDSNSRHLIGKKRLMIAIKRLITVNGSAN